MTCIARVCSAFLRSNFSHFLETKKLFFIVIQLTGCYMMRDIWMREILKQIMDDTHMTSMEIVKFSRPPPPPTPCPSTSIILPPLDVRRSISNGVPFSKWYRACEQVKSKQKQNQVMSHSNWPGVLFFDLAYKQCNGIITVCNFQSVKSSVELNSLLPKFFCFITWFVISPD